MLLGEGEGGREKGEHPASPAPAPVSPSPDRGRAGEGASTFPLPPSLIQVRQLGIADYSPTWQAMQAFTAGRGPETPDELWLLQHPPVYTLGLAGKAEHLLQASDVPVVKIDRGGQITYHGPGQAMVYLLIDLHRRNLKVRELVRLMEQALIDVLAAWGIAAERREGAPGVYVGEAKIAALGLKISRGCSYHGLALNVDMDLSPFGRINPCGYEGLATTQVKAEVKDSGLAITVAQAHEQLATRLAGLLSEHYPVPGGH